MYLSKLFNKLKKKILRNVIEIIVKYIPDDFDELLELKLAMRQGKWANYSLKDEVQRSLNLLDHYPSVFVDIGAHEGKFTSELLKIYPQTNCHLFEPSKKNNTFLNILFSDKENIFIHPYSLSDTNSIGKLYGDQSGSQLGSLTKRYFGKQVNIDFNFLEEVIVKRFDEYWLKENLPKKIDFMKIDVEGYELNVLRGLGDLIENISLIQFEFGGTHIDTRNFFRDFWLYFEEKKFKLFRITQNGIKPIDSYHENLEIFYISNYLALNTRIES